jgi:hypothetical protein
VPKPSLPMRLGMLVAGTTLPLILFAAGLVFYNYEQDREDASQRVLETVRSIRFELDAEVQRMTGGLQVLALTDALGQSEFEFERFRQISSGFLDQYGENASVLVSDRNGHQVFSSISANTTSLPSRHNLEIIDKVFTTGKPQYSDLFFGVVNKRPIVTVEVPAFHDGRVLYDVSFSPPIAKFQSIIEEQRPSNEWTISIFDTNGVSFAGVPNRTETFGKRASPSLYQEMFEDLKRSCRPHRSKACCCSPPIRALQSRGGLWRPAFRKPRTPDPSGATSRSPA